MPLMASSRDFSASSPAGTIWGSGATRAAHEATRPNRNTCSSAHSPTPTATHVICAGVAAFTGTTVAGSVNPGSPARRRLAASSSGPSTSRTRRSWRSWNPVIRPSKAETRMPSVDRPSPRVRYIASSDPSACGSASGLRASRATTIEPSAPAAAAAASAPGSEPRMSETGPSVASRVAGCANAPPLAAQTGSATWTSAGGGGHCITPMRCCSTNSTSIGSTTMKPIA